MLEEKDQRIIRALADGIPIVSHPFAELAVKAGMGEDEFLSRLRALKERGVLRRVGAVLQHRKAGFSANALCAWQVANTRLDGVGEAVSREAAVSHCYSREPATDWPYNFYAMIHAPNRKACEEIADRIAAENQLGERKTFYSVREWKKATMRYFCEDNGK
jgi:DNA-binding Lrp family transcriptional regulator